MEIEIVPRKKVNMNQFLQEYRDCNKNARKVRRKLIEVYRIEPRALDKAISRTAARFEYEFACSLHTTF